VEGCAPALIAKQAGRTYQGARITIHSHTSATGVDSRANIEGRSAGGVSLLELIATACAGIFSGAAIYISIVQHPAGLEVGGAFPARFFSPMYRRAAPMQAGLALVGSLAGFVAALLGSGLLWLLGALLLGSVVPFTLLRIKPVNDRLLDPNLDPSAPEIPELLSRWGRLHSVRSLVSCLAFLCFLAAWAAA